MPANWRAGNCPIASERRDRAAPRLPYRATAPGQHRAVRGRAARGSQADEPDFCGSASRRAWRSAVRISTGKGNGNRMIPRKTPGRADGSRRIRIERRARTRPGYPPPNPPNNSASNGRRKRRAMRRGGAICTGCSKRARHSYEYLAWLKGHRRGFRGVEGGASLWNLTPGARPHEFDRPEKVGRRRGREPIPKRQNRKPPRMSNHTHTRPKPQLSIRQAIDSTRPGPAARL